MRAYARFVADGTVAGACGLACLLNPFGYKLLLHTGAYLQNSSVRNTIAEFQAPTFRSEAHIYFMILLFAGLAVSGFLLANRRYGEALILGPGRRVGLPAGHLRLANRFFERWGLFAVFLGRLLPVIRTYISFPAGLSRITVVPFTLATIAGAIPWNLALAFAGFKLGQNYERVAGAIGPFTLPLAILVLLAIIVAYYYGRRIGETEAS